jgi:hypothetical protein
MFPDLFGRAMLGHADRKKGALRGAHCLWPENIRSSGYGAYAPESERQGASDDCAHVAGVGDPIGYQYSLLGLQGSQITLGDIGDGHDSLGGFSGGYLIEGLAVKSMYLKAARGSQLLDKLDFDVFLRFILD